MYQSDCSQQAQLLTCWANPAVHRGAAANANVCMLGYLLIEMGGTPHEAQYLPLLHWHVEYNAVCASSCGFGLALWLMY